MEEERRKVELRQANREELEEFNRALEKETSRTQQELIKLNKHLKQLKNRGESCAIAKDQYGNPKVNVYGYQLPRP